MGRFLIFVGLVILGIDAVAISARDFASFGLGLILAGGFLHVREP